LSKIKYIKPSDNVTTSNVSFKRISRGVLTSIIVTLILLVLCAAVFTYTDLEIRHSSLTVKIIFYLGALMSGLFSSLGIRNNGWIAGILGGLIYSLGIFILGALVTENFSFNLWLLTKVFTSIILGSVGGIIGINVKIKRKNK